MNAHSWHSRPSSRRWRRWCQWQQPGTGCCCSGCPQDRPEHAQDIPRLCLALREKKKHPAPLEICGCTFWGWSSRLSGEHTMEVDLGSNSNKGSKGLSPKEDSHLIGICLVSGIDRWRAGNPQFNRCFESKIMETFGKIHEHPVSRKFERENHYQ